ncbi:MAG: hypothetical protein V4519_05305 [Patescibacteria group bacterium]
MVDLGLYNFIKNAKAQGKSKEEIFETLSKGGSNQELISEAYTAVETNKEPEVSKRTDAYGMPVTAIRKFFTADRPTLITAICGYYFITWLLLILQQVILYVMYSGMGGVSFAQYLTLNVVTIMMLAAFIGVVGIWFMKRVGLYLYTISQIGSIVYIGAQYMESGISFFDPQLLWGVSFAYLVPIVLIVVGFRYFKRMV